MYWTFRPHNKTFTLLSLITRYKNEIKPKKRGFIKEDQRLRRLLKEKELMKIPLERLPPPILATFRDRRLKAGLARLAASKTKHGRYTKIEKAKAKARAQIGREIWKELKEIENWCIEHGHLKKNWRKDFYI